MENIMRFEDIEDKEHYFIQPYVEGSYRQISISSNANVVSVIALDENNKKVKLYNKIKKELVKSYQTSKFNAFPIVLEGIVSIDKKNRESLILFDIFLADEFNGKMQSKKYDIRYENLIFRFLNKTNQYVKAVFSHKFEEMSLNLLVDLFVKTDSLDKVVFRKNIPKGYEENEMIVQDIWTNLTGKIAAYDEKQGIKKEFDDKQNLVSETPFDYLGSFKVFCNEEEQIVIVDLSNFSESEKVEMLNDAEKFKGKECKFKRYDILNCHGYIFSHDELF